ncbi:hypothetical protein FJV41_08925 [Myxococcus llanfairpwllgwyngyllgogerychwyrndrobwllllantysiliogogogochensis]|uniref:Uncharacterized protein n=1 Tax=Myxococcus llanfairpwllgwyngyllgogerychwyrndrobwllllantysiliogogogochensis TaxID=2590453 RepID=A0A540X538_9BACT|nr:hypothetical protein [Myxococcus llanfairpwllgwyngyllgogerychwyrndrobwllllantysiliogogogochensis]TQF16358.1 hypothetical protein FJV41_08925 [Myxococcus llanfairpwllgwyngyllgogerychwyrndrobwllllantysiliogogogochensis]
MDPVEGVVMVLVVAMTCGIPLLGLTLRFSLKPVMEAFIRLREAQLGQHPDTAMLRARVAHLEHVLEVHGLIDGRALPLPSATAERVSGSVSLKDRERV